jgi:hypothetical protein
MKRDEDDKKQQGMRMKRKLLAFLRPKEKKSEFFLTLQHNSSQPNSQEKERKQ